MKMTWKKKSGNKRLAIPDLPFDLDNNEDQEKRPNSPPCPSHSLNSNNPPQQSNQTALADAFLQQGNKLAEDGEYREALGKWEAAISLTPENAVLHEQKAQVLLEVGDSWGALKAATRRAQLNFGEPDSATESFDKALAIKPELAEAQEDRQTALQLVKKRKQLHSSGLNTNKTRYAVRDGGKTDLLG